MPAVKNRSSTNNGARTTPDLIAEVLLEDISKGRLEPGQLLRQDELADRFGVSRIPVREALARLAKAGVVTVEPNRGASVTVFTEADVIEVFDLRLLLELDLMTRAVPKMTKADLEAAEEALLKAERGSRTKEWSKLDTLFHRALYAPADRPRQLNIVMTLRTLFEGSLAHQALPTKRKDWLKDHRAILAACRSGDWAKAAPLLEDHLKRASNVVLRRLAAHARAKVNRQEKKIHRSKTILEIRPNCECCDRDLPNGDPDARICTFECTFCARCVDELFNGVCPNCGGDFVRRPTRPPAHLKDDPPSTQRIVKYHPKRERLRGRAILAKA
jgi:DNA-binding GntR family transcriptional regulator